MKILLDTHTFLWFVLGDAQLSPTARSLIEDLATTKLISPAVYWELAIKISIGKYKLNEPFESFLDRGIIQNGFLILPIEPSMRQRLRRCLFIIVTHSTGSSLLRR